MQCYLRQQSSFIIGLKFHLKVFGIDTKFGSPNAKNISEIFSKEFLKQLGQKMICNQIVQKQIELFSQVASPPFSQSF